MKKTTNLSIKWNYEISLIYKVETDHVLSSNIKHKIKRF